MADEGHLETEKLLKDLEKRIAKEYKQAIEETQAKLDDYMRRFKKKDLKWQEWVEEGKKTKEEYKQWRVGQIAVGKRWEAMKEQLAEDYHNTNVIARSIMDGYMPEIYAINHNFATYDVEHELSINTSYTLYDRQTAERLIRDNPDMLPPPGKKVSAKIAAGKDLLWNKQQIQSVMLQSLLQGESIPKIADRLALEVGDSNYKAAIRNARTMTTGAQNAGRVDGYKRAQDMGIELRHTWVATLDNRTRHSHRQLDGETVDIGIPFKVDGYEIMFPGDPSAPPHLVYNCRCTLIGQIKGFERNIRGFDLRNDPDVSGMTYEEWKNARKSESNSITLSKEKGEAIAESYRKEYRDGVFGAKTASYEDSNTKADKDEFFHKKFGKGQIVGKDEESTYILFEGKNEPTKIYTSYLDKVRATDEEIAQFKKNNEQKQSVVVDLSKVKTGGKTQEELKSLSQQYARLTYDMSPKERYELANIFTKEKANEENFFKNSVGFWEKKSKAPNREPDHISYNKRTQEKSSQYWYTEKGVYRKSDHWGSDVASCSWYIDGRNYSTEGVSKGREEVAFISWEDLKAKGMIGHNLETDVYFIVGFEFDK